MSRRLAWAVFASLVATADLGGCSAGDSGDRDACDGIVAVDFPCRNESFCQSPTVLRGCHSLECWEVVGHHCCIGGQCGGPSTTDECPPGTVCFEFGRGVPYGLRGQCLPDPDAGDAGDVDYDGWTRFEPGAAVAGCW